MYHTVVLLWVQRDEKVQRCFASLPLVNSKQGECTFYKSEIKDIIFKMHQ